MLPFVLRLCSKCSSKLSFMLSRNVTSLKTNENIAFRKLICQTNLRNVSTDVKTTAKSRDFRRLLSLAKPEKWRVAGALSLLVVSSTVTMAVPFAIGKVIDIIYSTAASKDEMIQKLNDFTKFLLGVFVLGQRIIRRLRVGLFESILKQEVAFFDKNKTGELVNRLSADTSVVGQSITNNISDGLRASAQAIGGVGMMFYVSPSLAQMTLCTVLPIAAFSIVYGRYVRKITREVQDALAATTQVAEERIGNIRTVRALAAESREIKRYFSRAKDVLDISGKEARAKALFWGFSGFSGNILILAVFYNGGLMMTSQAITVGDLTSFLLYAAYVGVAMGGLTSFYTESMRGLGASSRLWELMDKEPLIPLNGGKRLDIPDILQESIRFSNVYFAYPVRPEMDVFCDLSFDLKAGEVLAFVGASGSGKSSIVSLLLRFYDPTKGTITVDGHNLTSFSPTWLRSQIGFVSQEPVLFSSSIAENIAYGAREAADVTRDEIIAAAKTTNCLDFIESFPDGFETVVGEKGILLSGGQKQRVAIARAILKNPHILLLDEATSALDAESEHQVQEALERVMQGRTVIIIAHRLSTIRNADRVAVLHNGRIAEHGTYEDLMQIEEGQFRRLVERQTIVPH